MDGVSIVLSALGRVDACVLQTVEQFGLWDQWLLRGHVDAPIEHMVRLTRLKPAGEIVQLELDINLDEDIVLPISSHGVMVWADRMVLRLLNDFTSLRAHSDSATHGRSMEVRSHLRASVEFRTRPFLVLREQSNWVAISLAPEEREAGFEDWDVQIDDLETAEQQIRLAIELGPGFARGNVIAK